MIQPTNKPTNQVTIKSIHQLTQRLTNQVTIKSINKLAHQLTKQPKSLYLDENCINLDTIQSQRLSKVQMFGIQFSFCLIGCYAKAKKPSLPDYFRIACGWREKMD